MSRYSFSKLSCFEQCPYQFYKKYIENEKGDDNFYAQAGALMHELLASIINKDITVEEAIELFTDRFDIECSAEVAEATREKVCDAMIGYLGNVDEHQLDHYSILGVEQEIEFDIGNGNTMIGYIDLLLFNADGKLIVVDHKSSGCPVGRNGKVYKGKEALFEAYKRQLYIYSMWVEQTYGEKPAYLAWNHFKSGVVNIVKFDDAEYEATKEWVRSAVAAIETEKAFEPKKDFFFCHNLCPYRNGLCEYLDEEEEEDDG